MFNEDRIGSEEKLITDLVSRVIAQTRAYRATTGYQTLEQLALERIKTTNEEALIHLSASKLNVIISGLAEGLDNLLKKKDKEENVERATKAQAEILELMAKCMAFQWDHIKAQFRNVQGLDEKEAIRLKEKEEQILPPPLEELLAKLILGHAMQFLVRQEQELRDTAGRLLFQLSATNYDTVFSKISESLFAIINGKDTEENTVHFFIMEYLNLNSKRLAELLERVSKAAGFVKKDRQQTILAQVVRKAIWNWIDNYPMEFVSLCQSATRLGGNPDTLFDTLDTWAKKNKTNFWPLQTMLLILCPDIMLKLLNKNNTTDTSSKEKFLDTIKKALKGKGADMAAICYVDICKASTFVSKSDLSALRYMVPSIETELKEKLFNPASPPRAGGESGPVDVELMTDCLVSSFRLNPRKVLTSLFLECVNSDAPPHFKSVVVKSLLRIVREGNNLPWNPTISDCYASLSGPLRALFQEYVQGLKSYNTLVKATDKKSRQQLEKLTYDISILLDLIRLFNADPDLPLFPLKTPAQDLEDVRNVLTGLCFCSTHFSLPELAEAASQALLHLHDTNLIGRWCAKGLVNGFWEISAAVNVSLANALIDQRDIKLDQIQKAVTILEEILIRRNDFLDKYKESHKPDAQVKDVRFQGITKLEVALLIHLCSPEPDICSKCATCFGLLCDEVDILGELDEGNSIVANYPAYRKLATVGILQTGRQHQQKAIRMLLRRVYIPTTGNFAAWEDVYARWKQSTENLLQIEESEKKKASSTPTKPSVDKKTEDIKQEWQNYLGFLLGLSGVTLDKETTVKVVEEKGRSKKNAQNTAKTVKVVDGFIDEVMELMICDSAFIREIVMTFTGTSIAPAAYSALFRHLQDEVQGFFGDAGQIEYSDKSILFVDQAVSVVKHVLELPQETEDLSLVTSFESLILLFMKFISQLLMNSVSLRIKKNMCATLELLMNQRQYISFRKEFDFRNALVENVMEWTSDFAMKSLGGSTDGTASAGTVIAKKEDDAAAKNEAAMTKKLLKELDIGCVAAIAALLRGLPLPAESQTAKFSKYFTFFTTLLTRTKQDKESPPQLAEYAIKSLSNLLSANIHAGLDYFVTMGYHDDHETRSAFLKVISNILNQGTEFDQLEEGDRYEKLVELLIEPELSVVLSLGESTQITEADEVAHLLVRIFAAQDKAMLLVKKIITQEVAQTESGSTLFRRNSVATKLLGSFTKLIGPNYLKDTLGPVFRDLIATPLNCEIDPTKLQAGEDPNINIENLKTTIDTFLTAISTSINLLPMPIHEICNFMYKIVAERFPGNERLSIGGFMFLRFLCPAVVAPDGFGLLSAGVLNKDTRRTLVLVTKVLQNLANNTQFKEPFMAPMNLYVQDHLKQVSDIFDAFAEIPADCPPGKTVHYNEEQYEEDMRSLHYHISMNLEKMNKLLAASDLPAAERLAAILQRLGPPPEFSAKQKVANMRTPGGGAQKTGNYYEEFMRANADKNTDSIKQKKIFYQQGTTKEKWPVLYFIARSFESTIDMDLLLLHILRTLQEVLDHPFVIVIDCTSFGPEHQFALPWCVKYVRHFPDMAGTNLKNIFLVNANHVFKKYSKRIAKLVGTAQKKITLLPSALKLAEYIEGESGLPASTVAVETDVKATFSPVQKVSGHHQTKDVVIRISTDMVQVLTVKAHPLLNKNVPLIDLLHISCIQEVTHANQDTELDIRYEEYGGQKSMTFRSPSAQQIIQAIKASKARWNLSKPATSTSRTFRPSDIPGTLLNVALLNLCSTRNSLRVAAYNMLTSLCKKSNFSIKLQLLEINGLCIPKNSSPFVVSVSRKLAKTETGLTLEFLTECLHGITKASASAKHLVLEYMQPWFMNLPMFCQKSADSPEKYNKTVEVINSLIELTMRETAMKPSVLSYVWQTIGRSESTQLVTLAVKCCLKKAIEAGMSTTRAEVIQEIVSTMGVENSQLVAGRIITKILKILDKTNAAPAPDLVEHEVWPSTAVLIQQLLALSFDDVISVQQFLPELFHIVLMTFGIGNATLRAISHGLLINLVHSLYTSLVTPENKMSALQFHLTEFGQPSFRLLFGIQGSNASAFSPAEVNAHKLEKIPIMNVDVVANAMFNVLNCCSPHNNCLGTAWHSRWLATTTAAAFQPNPPVQARAFIVLGVLSRSSDLVSDDLIEQVLTVLRNNCTPKGIQDQNDLIVGMLLSLTRLYEYLPTSSKYTHKFFWLAMTIVQINEPRIFVAGVGLLDTIIKQLDAHDSFREAGLARMLLMSRSTCSGILDKLDQFSGVSFETNFSFAVASHMLKGLRFPSTKTATVKLLTTLLNIAAKRSSGPEILGYLAALLPTEGVPTNIDQLLPVSSAGGMKNLFNIIFSEVMLPDETHCALLFYFLATILQNTDREHEQLFIYETLKQGINYMPGVFPVVYKTLIPKLSTVISSSQSDKMVVPGLEILEAMFSFVMESVLAKNRLNTTFLKKIGFNGMPDCATGFSKPNPQVNDQILKTSTELITTIIGGSGGSGAPLSGGTPGAQRAFVGRENSSTLTPPPTHP